jgi:transposase-like protein
VSTSGLVDTKQQPGTTKRRQYSEGLKRQMVAETQVPGASVSIVACPADRDRSGYVNDGRGLWPLSVGGRGSIIPQPTSSTRSPVRRLSAARTTPRRTARSCDSRWGSAA